MVDGFSMWLKLVAIVSMGGVLVFGAALVSKAKSPTSRSGGGVSSGSYDPRPVSTISTGDAVDLLAHVTDQSEWTVFEFAADW